MRRLFLLLFFLPAVADGLMLLQLNLEQLTGLSERVFVGRCVAVDHRRDEEGRQVQAVTFEVNQVLKGNPANRITFKQIESPDLPVFQVGEEDVVFLAGPHPETGLTAPIGLGQGKFLIRKSAEGPREVINGYGNRGLLVGVSRGSKLKALRSHPPRGPLPYDDFVSLVESLVR